MADDGVLEPQELVELLEAYLMGGPPTLTRLELVEAAGVDLSVAQARWKSLGFTEVGDFVPAFTQADLDALRMTQELHEMGFVEPEEENALIRTLGRNFARLAEWQLLLLGNIVDPRTHGVGEMTAVIDEVVPRIEALQTYVWRRHLVNVASRMLLAPDQDDPAIVVGFADIVGYTRQSRSMTQEELGRLVEDFEAAALQIMTENGGRIIKTIGDEVMFVVDDPLDAAEIGLRLLELHQYDESFPQLRVGLAYGRVLRRLGDVFGPTVNIAARLTSVAAPGKALVDRELAEAVAEDGRYWVRRSRRTSVKGYRRLEPWKLRRFDGDLTSPAAYFAEKRKDFIRAVDEVQARIEGAVAGQGPQQGPGGQGAGPVVPADQHHG